MVGFFILKTFLLEQYKDINHDSNITYCEIGDIYIRVKFKRTAKIYTYSYQSAGIEKVERLKKLARAGNGLNCYIKLYVNSLYEK